MLGGGGFTHIRTIRWRGERGGAGFSGKQTFHAARLKVPRQVIRHAGFLVVEIGLAGDVAVGVIRGGLGCAAAAARAGFRHASGFNHAQDGLEVVGAGRAERVGDEYRKKSLGDCFFCIRSGMGHARAARWRTHAGGGRDHHSHVSRGVATSIP